MLLSAPGQDTLVPEDDSTLRLEWESSAGGEEVLVARLRLPPYVFAGPGDPHWIGQRCGILECVDPNAPTVVLVCGCRARVPCSALKVASVK